MIDADIAGRRIFWDLLVLKRRLLMFPIRRFLIKCLMSLIPLSVPQS